jgi:WD40 repeat protein
MLDVGDDLASEYKADALRFKESKELRSLLVATVKECAGHTKGYREFLYQQLTPILRDFRLHGAGDGDTPNAKIGYMFTEINKGRIEWAMTIFLAWLCVYHEDAAAKFYARANLAEKGKPYRQYRGEAGQWAAARNAAKPPVGPDASANPDPGPILPDDIGQIGEGPAIVAQIPTRAPIRFPHPDGICNASFSPCGKLIVTAGKKAQSGDAGAFVWRIDVSAASQDKRKIASHSSDILFAGFSPEGRHVISTAANIAKVSYSTALVEPLFTLRHEKQIALCTYSDDGKRIATGSWDGTARVWDAQSGKLLKTIRPGVRRNHAVNSAYFSPNGAHLLLGSSDSSISIWHIGSATRVSNFVSDESDGVCSAIYSRDGKSILTAGPGDGRAYIWDTSSRKITHIFGLDESHEDTIWSAEFNSDGTLVVTASQDRTALVWDVGKRVVVARLKHPSPLYAAHFSPDDTQVLTACDDGCAYLWRVG